MKLRHAAALALMGWYLMFPPPGPRSPDGTTSLDYNAPISEWSSFGVFDTADECRAEMKRQNEQKLNPADRGRYEVPHSQCIATDDPRLAR